MKKEVRMKRQDREPTAPSLASRLSLSRLRGAATLLVALTCLFGTASCAKAPEKPPESALKHAKDFRPQEPDETDLERRHLAPPPAYGNKVVMAEERRFPSERF